MRNGESQIYEDMHGGWWVIFKRKHCHFEMWPEAKGPDCIEADVQWSLGAAKELIEYMASADETERAKWEQGRIRPMRVKPISIWIKNGMCEKVFNLPEGCTYEVIDTDGDDKEVAQKRINELIAEDE